MTSFKSTYVPLSLALSYLFLCGGVSYADSEFDLGKLSNKDLKHFLIVSNFSSMTYGANLLCKNTSPRTKKRIEDLITETYTKFPELKALVEASPFIERGRESNRAFIEKNMHYIKSPDELEAACNRVGDRMRGFMDSPQYEEWTTFLKTQLN